MEKVLKEINSPYDIVKARKTFGVSEDYVKKAILAKPEKYE